MVGAFVVGVMNMAKEYAKPFYKSAAWLRCRDSYIRSVGGLCERCYAKGLIRAGVIVHHKCYISPENINDPTVTLNYDNLELLCQECHNNEHFEQKKRFFVDGFGKVTAL